MEVYNDLKEINETFGASVPPTQLDVNLVAIFHPEELIWYVFEFNRGTLTWDEKLTTLTLNSILG